MSFPFLKAPSGAAGVVGKVLLLSVVVLGGAPCAASSQVWRLLRKLGSGGGCCFLSADPPSAPSFISVRPLDGDVGGSGRGVASGAAAGLDLSFELWVVSAMVRSWGNLSAFRRCGALRSGARGKGSLFGVRDRVLASFRSCGRNACSVPADDAPYCPCFSWCLRS